MSTTETKVRHSTLPWSLGENGDGCAKGHAIVADGMVIAKVYGRGYPSGAGWHPQSAADAGLIVRAVNSHADMLEALEAALPYLPKKPCSKCRIPFEPTARQLRRGWYVCKPCWNAYQSQYRRKRRATGRPLSSGSQLPREYHQEYAKTYRRKRKVLDRRAQAAVARRADPDQQFKIRARIELRNAIRRKDIVRLPCEVCSNPKAQGHHEDYARPLVVVWLCAIHHTERHSAKGGAA